MAETKSEGQKLQEQLLIDNERTKDLLLDDEVTSKADAFCEEYKHFLTVAKTEREAVKYIESMARKKGYVEFDPATKYAPGQKVFYNNRGKAIILATVGTRPFTDGVKIVASHIDSPRLDLKPRPLYEEAQLAMFKTHYYGGIKKYQWTALPLALHGVIAKKDGSMIDVCIGEEEDEPVFCVTDLLPHLGKEQSKRTLYDGIRGEELNILVGSRPFKDDKASEKVKLNIAKLLFDKYGITEYDFLSAELTMVPAFGARDLGLDRSMIGSYGHDDRVCAYPSLMAELEMETPAFTHVSVFTDKEEIGSVGNTGLDSSYLRYFIADLAAPYGVPGRTVLSKSECLSADVTCAYDPTFSDVTERRNTAYVNYGVCVTKYTGAGGKSDTNDASAQFVAKVRALLDDEKVEWQTGELGKVDGGGGGTVAMYIANLNVDVVDMGVPVLSMHSPFEVVSKTDVYMTYRAFCAFLNQK